MVTEEPKIAKLFEEYITTSDVERKAELETYFSKLHRRLKR